MEPAVARFGRSSTREGLGPRDDARRDLVARDLIARDLIVLALLAACFYLPGLGARDLWNPDEPRYAQVAREMVESGQYLVPHYNGRLYTEKPPLMFWSMAASGALLGRLDETATRLPSALAAIGCVLLVYSLGQRLFDRRAGWLAAGVFGTCSKIVWQARVGQIDMLLTFLVLAAVFWWVRGRLEARSAFSYLFFAFAGLATLAKGPAGLLPPLLAILVFLAIIRDGRGLRDLKLASGLALWAGVVLLWLAPAILTAGGEYSNEILLRQNVTRYVDSWGHRQPPWYFLQTLPLDFLPWSLYVPAAIAAGRGLDRERRRHLLFLGCWVVVTVLFFSVSPGKRTVYLLTCYPALAILVGAGLAALSRSERVGRAWLAWPAAGLALLLWGTALALPFASRWVEVPSFAAPLLVPAALSIGAFAAAATLALWYGLRRKVGPLAGALAAGTALAAAPLFGVILPQLDPEMSLRSLATTIQREMPEGWELASLHEMEGGLLFYGSGFARELEDEKDLRGFLTRRSGVWLVIDPDDLDGLDRPLDLPLAARQGVRADGVRILASP